MGRKLIAAALSACAVLVVGAAPAAAREWRVDNDHAECPKAQFTSIQAAVTAATPNDTIKVCPGTYTEQVKIEGPGKEGLSLESLLPLQARIQNPLVQTPPNAIVHIGEADRVDVRGFVISGPYAAPGCVPPQLAHTGVFVDNASRARIRHNHITQVRSALPSLFGCQDGLAVLIGRRSVDSVGSAEVSHNMIDEYQKGGVVVDNEGSEAEVDHNTVRAADAVQPIIAPNGVQVSRGAEAFVRDNDVSENKFGGNPNAGNGTGILLFQPQPGGVRVVDNEVYDNDDGIALNDTDGSRIHGNHSHDNVLYDGIFVDSDSAENFLTANRMFGNAEHDCHDDSAGDGSGGTANEWHGNKGNTQNRPELCHDATVVP